MNCASARNRLLALPDPADVPPPVAGHLAACAACSAWHSLLVQVEGVVTSTPVPASDGRARGKLLEQFRPAAEAPAAPKPVKAPGKSAVKLTVAVVVPAKRSAFRDRLARLWPVGLVAAAILVGSLAWAILGGPNTVPPVVAKARDPMLDKVMQAKTEFDNAETSPDRLKVLNRLASTIHEQARDLSRVNPGDDMESLSRMYEQVVMDALVATARSLGPDEQKLLLGGYIESLRKAADDADSLAQNVPPDSVRPLKDMARVARQGKEQLARMVQKEGA